MDDTEASQVTAYGTMENPRTNWREETQVGQIHVYHNRGVEDILIACVDGLTGFPEAIASIYPDTEVQQCVIHQIRNSLKYVASKHQKEFMADLKHCQ
ncbi:hypothetical protein GCM10007938_18670 [Vibrio zhanjiangensis]|uniref:Mutator family transposase n=1 Tax=Vibrio zhanjiangensis TaxID=1046128 RepID=A0ABQ6EYN3_9VIBR|nr:hypothetical protein GCM10007938_18670 [Vibrio zhanjiangensis]